jgi:hypothetical protein
MPSTSITGDQRYLKAINRMNLLRLLREQAGMSRAELAERSGLTRSTVSARIKELIAEGWLSEESASATGGPGRRPTPLNVDGFPPDPPGRRARARRDPRGRHLGQG